MKRIVAGILAHVDSGKTTLSEAMLFRSGEIRKLGRVDHGDAFLDTDTIEREKGITIFSKQAELSIGDTNITLLDTPGHVDFSTETERTLSVIDYAVLVISGTDGVQNHTETLWRLLIRYGVPAFIFVNKMDISQRSAKELIADLRARLGDGFVDFSADRSELAEDAAMCSEELMEEFLENEDVSDDALRRAIQKRKLFPCCFGSALKLDGVDEFLKVFDRYTVSPSYPDEFGARVFKIAQDTQGKRLTYTKLTGGNLKVKTLLEGHDQNGEPWSEKVNQIRIYSGAKFSTTDTVYAGEICAVTGLSATYPGEGLGSADNAKTPVLEPVLTYRIELEDGVDVHTALMNMRRLEEEEPQLHIIWNEPLQEIHIQLMGEVQLEVLKRIISERFKMNIEFGQGSIAYKETIAAPVEGVGHYEPLRHYAEVHLLMEPGKRGSGLVFKSNCPEDNLDKNWQRLILTHLKEKSHSGVLTGSPITDMKITLVAGRAHKKHTEGGDFRQATYRAVRQGLKSAESVLLEPWYNFRLEVPTENVGRAMTDIEQLGGSFSPPEVEGDMSVISGSAPVSEMRGYHSEVTGYTGGRGRLSCSLKGYEPCHNAKEVIGQIGYDSDADTDNPADSVFCSHGAGFIVKWDEVKNYMHVESPLNLDEPEEQPSEQERASAYVERVVDDEELLRIFEKTYGPVKQKTHSPMRTKKAPSQSKYKGKPVVSQGPEYLLVDGYNIIFAWDDLKSIAEDNLEAARERLISIMCNYQGYRQCRLILVFDAYRVKNNPGEIEKINNINVVYTKEAETADMYIEKVTHELGRKHRVRVATSDNLEQIIILGNGATRISADSFKKEVENAENEIRDYLKKMNLGII